MPNSVRSTTVSSSIAMRSLPSKYCAGPASVPVDSTRLGDAAHRQLAARRFRCSPSCSSVVAVKVISGWRSASKKSGPWRWPLSWSTGTSTESTLTAPVRTPSSSLALRSENVPRKLRQSGVLDGEGRLGVDGVQLPGAGGEGLLGEAHGVCLLFRRDAAGSSCLRGKHSTYACARNIFPSAVPGRTLVGAMSIQESHRPPHRGRPEVPPAGAGRPPGSACCRRTRSSPARSMRRCPPATASASAPTRSCRGSPTRPTVTCA